MWRWRFPILKLPRGSIERNSAQKYRRPNRSLSMASGSSSSTSPIPGSSFWSRSERVLPSPASWPRNPAGGMPHLCYEVDDIRAARDRLREGGARVLGDGEPKIGAHGRPVIFLSPKDFVGTLIELEEAAK